ncbi:MAG: hypothetical protein ABI282_11325 [Candidatus Baltobacteraceae bacterium]
MTVSTITAWAALALVPITALLGLLLRRLRAGTFIRRMRPHFVLGYAALVLALVHVGASMGAMGGANGTGIWLALIALLGLGLQAFTGTNLQSPGSYRTLLRRWHVVLFAAVLVFALGHILLNAAFLPQSSASTGTAVTASATRE